MTSQSLSGRENVNTSITHFGHQSHHCTKMDSNDRSTEAVFLPRFTLLVSQKFGSGINFCPIYTIMYLYKKLPKIIHLGHQSYHCAKMDSIDRSTEAVFLPRFTLLGFQNFRSGINFYPIYTIMYLFMKLPRITHFRHKSDHCAKMDSIDRSTEAVFPPRFTLFQTQNKNQPKAGFCPSGFINFALPKNLCTYQVVSNIT